MNTKEIFKVLPENLNNQLSNINNLDKLQEIRIKIGKPLLFQVDNKEVSSSYIVNIKDMTSIMQRMSNYSMYTFEEEIKQGYITINGGHRVGICGRCIIDGGKVKTIKNIGSLNIRICRQVLGCSKDIMNFIVKNQEVINTIIISPPKCGKTTILRDIVKNLSTGVKNSNFKGKKVCVIDERSEIAASFNGVPQLDIGYRTDVMDNCPKSEGIIMAIRSMAPDVIVCDEIGTYKDMESILCALNSGVNLITTIHGFGIEDLYKRPVFKDIVENNVFKRAVVLSSRKGVGTLEYIYDFNRKEKIWGA
ncbi:stage III sporulation protein AA [Clostridium niameyense]|uniref:Stage III sporulation protein AA n=1 Tax=Clostridium niameyense TaxID=1622073 RepID=A0A6M0R7V6_9CLOT|nr:stage III sporulation protein AA [Clostridium niameyense]NEZ46313.1 stage III sporulation protein AA [Clostridium niameyense]